MKSRTIQGLDNLFIEKKSTIIKKKMYGYQKWKIQLSKKGGKAIKKEGYNYQKGGTWNNSIFLIYFDFWIE